MKSRKRGGGGCIVGRKCLKNKRNEEELKRKKEKEKRNLENLQDSYYQDIERLEEQEQTFGLNHTKTILELQNRINDLSIILETYKEPRIIIGRTGKTKTRRVR